MDKTFKEIRAQLESNNDKRYRELADEFERKINRNLDIKVSF